MKVLGCWPQNQLDVYFLTVLEHWLGLAKPKNVFRSIPSNSYEILKISYLTYFSTDWLACLVIYLLSYLLMPSNKHNSRMATKSKSISIIIWLNRKWLSVEFSEASIEVKKKGVLIKKRVLVSIDGRQWCGQWLMMRSGTRAGEFDERMKRNWSSMYRMSCACTIAK